MDPATIITLANSLGLSGGGGEGGQSSGAMSTFMGAQQFLRGKIKDKKAEEARPPMEDPQTRMFLEEIQRERAAIQRGTGPTFSAALKDLKSSRASVSEGAVRVAGGSKGLAMRTLTDIYKSGAEAIGKIAGEQEQKALSLLPIQERTLNRITQRKFDLRLHDFLQKKAEAAQLVKSGEENLFQGMASMAPLGGEDEPIGGGTGTPSGVEELPTSGPEFEELEGLENIFPQQYIG